MESLTVMQRREAHSQHGEPWLEHVLSDLRWQKIIRLIPMGSDVLDLGCGYSGRFLKRIQLSASSCTGVDISVDPASDGSGVRLIAHDLGTRLPFPDASFDVITSLANLEHLTDPSFALSEMYRVLRPGGIVLLTTPSISAKPVLEFLSFTLHLVSETEIADHKHYFNKIILTDLFRAAGFRDTSHTYFQCLMNNFVRASK